MTEITINLTHLNHDGIVVSAIRTSYCNCDAKTYEVCIMVDGTPCDCSNFCGVLGRIHKTLGWNYDGSLQYSYVEAFQIKQLSDLLNA